MMVCAELLDYSGHLTARIPDTDRVLIQPRDASRAGLQADDILIVDLDGRLLEGNGRPPTETAIRRCPYCSAWSTRRWSRPEISAFASSAARFIPIRRTSAPWNRAPRWRR